MRSSTLALSIAICLLCCPVAIAQVPKFTIVSMTREPPGPIPPGGKFKLKVTVRNDGDTIPAGRRFDFAFTTPDALAIGQPTGTPALFFGFCPGATPITMVCQCFAAWEKGQTVEMETEVTAGSGARGAVTVTFRVTSGSVSDTATTTVQIALAGPDLLPDAGLGSFESDPPKTQIRGRVQALSPFVTNAGTTTSSGPITLKVQLSGGTEFYLDNSGSLTRTLDEAIAPGMRGSFRSVGDRIILAFKETGVQSIFLTVSGGGDVEPSNNTKTIQFEVIRDEADALTRLELGNKLAEILGR